MTEIYYFTGTGNSYYIAQRIGELLGKAYLVNIAKMVEREKIVSNANSIGVIFPVYFLTAPDIVIDFCKKLEVREDAYIFLISNAGGMEGFALSDVRKIFESKDIEVGYENNVYLPDNSIVFPTKEEKIQPMLEQGKKKILKIGTAIRTKEKRKHKSANMLIRPIGSGIRYYSEKYLKFKEMHVNEESCSNCGLCEKICPMKNIESKENIKFGEKCEMCFSCIHRCPNQSIKFKRMKMKNGYQYTNPYVSSKEIIDVFK